MKGSCLPFKAQVITSNEDETSHNFTKEWRKIPLGHSNSYIKNKLTNPWLKKK